MGAHKLPKASLVAVHVEPLRPDEADLRWYFGTRREEEELLQSGFPALVRHLVLKRLEESLPPVPPVWEFALDARLRHGRIATILAATEPGAVEVLRTALGPELALFPKQLGRLGRLVASSKRTASAHRRSESKKALGPWFSDLMLCTAWDPRASTLVSQLYDEAEGRYRAALLAYREGKRRTGLTGREAPAARMERGDRHG